MGPVPTPARASSRLQARTHDRHRIIQRMTDEALPKANSPPPGGRDLIRPMRLGRLFRDAALSASTQGGRPSCSPATIASMNVRSHPRMNFKTEPLAHQAEHRRLFRFEPTSSSRKLGLNLMKRVHCGGAGVD
jgi:hypothetical protein